MRAIAEGRLDGVLWPAWPELRNHGRLFHRTRFPVSWTERKPRRIHAARAVSFQKPQRRPGLGGNVERYCLYSRITSHLSAFIDAASSHAVARQLEISAQDNTASRKSSAVSAVPSVMPGMTTQVCAVRECLLDEIADTVADTALDAPPVPNLLSVHDFQRDPNLVPAAAGACAGPYVSAPWLQPGRAQLYDSLFVDRTYVLLNGHLCMHFLSCT